jgi:hypothetical protein
MGIDWSKIIPETYIYGVFGAVFTVLLYVLRITAKKVAVVAKTEWAIVTSRLERIENVQGVQAANHLTHIQENTEKTNLILDAMRLEQAESNGYLRAITHGYMKNIVEIAPEVAKIVKPSVIDAAAPAVDLDKK